MKKWFQVRAGKLVLLFIDILILFWLGIMIHDHIQFGKQCGEDVWQGKWNESAITLELLHFDESNLRDVLASAYDAM